jgi:FAD/FMN-containing dehydrogenase
MPAPLPQAFLDALSFLDDTQLKSDKDSLEHWGRDWTKHFEPDASLIVFPRSTEEVARLVKAAFDFGVALTPSGGRTGLSAGAVAANGEVVVSLDKMTRVIEFFEADRLVHVEAGMVTEALQNFALDQGLYYPVDFASAGSSQIGGNIGTNAGGIKVIRYGMTRQWVLGLTVVTGTGEVLHLNQGMMKNATGYDFRHLMCGAEGTLGIVTEAMIKLERAPKNLTVMVLGSEDFGSIMKILSSFQKRVDLTAFEYFGDLAMQKVIDAGHTRAPFESRTPFYALLEFEAPYNEIMDEAMNVFEECLEAGYAVDGVMSQSESQAQSLWALREGISESIAPFTPYKNDISVLIGRVPDFMSEIEAIVSREYPEFEICWFGHIGDGNLHLNILKPENLTKDEFFERCKQVNVWVFEIVKKYGGSVSAEHGVGMTKKPYLNYSRSEGEIEIMRAVKRAFDPKGIMNPGKIFDLKA